MIKTDEIRKRLLELKRSSIPDIIPKCVNFVENISDELDYYSALSYFISLIPDSITEKIAGGIGCNNVDYIKDTKDVERISMFLVGFIIYKKISEKEKFDNYINIINFANIANLIKRTNIEPYGYTEWEEFIAVLVFRYSTHEIEEYILSNSIEMKDIVQFNTEIGEKLAPIIGNFLDMEVFITICTSIGSNLWEIYGDNKTNVVN